MADLGFTEKIPNASGDDKSPSKKYLVEYYTRMGAFLDQCYEEGTGMQQDVPEIKQIQDSLDYLLGMQWKETMPNYRAKPVTNELLSCFWETIGLLTDIKPMFTIKDIGGDDKYSAQTSILNKLGKGWASNTGFERKNAFWTMFAMLTTSPAKIYYNPMARGYTGDSSDGDITMEVLPTTSLLRVGDGETYQDDECDIYRRVRTLNWIKRAYPRMGKLVQPEESKSKYTVDVQAPVTVMPQLFQSLSPGMKRMMGASEKTNIQSCFPKAEVREFWMKDDSENDTRNKIWMGPEGAAWGYWVMPGKKLYPRGRLIVRANGVTLYDEPNPYFHRRKPFVPLALYDVPWQQYAMSVLSPWMKQQDILNQIFGGLIQSVKKAVNPPLLASKSAIHPDSLRAIDSSKPNLKISYSANAAQAPTWGNPPNIPAYVFNAIAIIQKQMRSMSGGSAMDEAVGKKQVPGGDTLDRITFSKTTPIRMMGRNIEESVNELGQMWTADAIQFYDAAQRIELLGKSGLVKEDIDDSPGSLIPDKMEGEAYVRRFHFKVDKGTLLNVQRQDKIQIGFALRKNKDISRDQLFDILDWNINREENKAQLAEEMTAQASAMAAAGVQPKGHK